MTKTVEFKFNIGDEVYVFSNYSYMIDRVKIFDICPNIESYHVFGSDRRGHFYKEGELFASAHKCYENAVDIIRNKLLQEEIYLKERFEGTSSRLYDSYKKCLK